MATNTTKRAKTQNELIETMLRKGKTLTTEEAREKYGIQSLSSRVSELRKTKRLPIKLSTKVFKTGPRRGERVNHYSLNA
jgi:hypothetical protein